MQTEMLLAQRDKALARVKELEDAIRLHMNERGDDRCWMDDERLYKTLPEGFTPPDRDTAVELHNCRLFILNRRHPETRYESPDKLLAEQRGQIEALRKQLHQQKLYADTAVEVDAMRLRQIEKERTEIAFLRQMLSGMTRRVVEQSELLSKRAELKPSDNNDMRIDEL